MDNMIAGMVIGNMISQNNDAEYRQELAMEEERRHFMLFCPEKSTLDARIAEFILMKDTEGARDFLTKALVRELVFRARNQRPYPLTLDQKIDRIRQKYQSCYDTVKQPMPEHLRQLTAEQLCTVAGVKELPAISQKEYEKLYRDEEKEEQGSSILKNFLIVLVIVAVCCLFIWLLVELI